MHLNFKELLQQVKGFVFDVDGVLSNNIILNETGDMMRTMNLKDGYAIAHALKMGYSVAIITGASSPSVQIRFENLGVKHIYLGSQNKIVDFKKYLKKSKLNRSEILYMGDDLPDFEIMSVVGVPVCPLDAVSEIKQISKYVSYQSGGNGCVRDVIEQTLKVQGKWVNVAPLKWE